MGARDLCLRELVAPIGPNRRDDSRHKLGMRDLVVGYLLDNRSNRFSVPPATTRRSGVGASAWCPRLPHRLPHVLPLWNPQFLGGFDGWFPRLAGRRMVWSVR